MTADQDFAAVKAVHDYLVARGASVDIGDLATALALYDAMTDGAEDDMTPTERALARLEEVSELLEADVKAVGPDGDWEPIYDRLFTRNPNGYQPRVFAALDDIGWRFPDYYDPDTSYREDVEAWLKAFREVLGNLRTFEATRIGTVRPR